MAHKLTKIQRETLELLGEGEIMEVDRFNMTNIGAHSVAFSTRTFLTKNRFVTKKDESKAVTTKGNGYVITEKGKKVLCGEV